MKGGSKRAARVRRRGAASLHPDWEALPEAVLFKILQEVSKAGDVPHHFLVCKRWLRVGKEAQVCFHPDRFWDEWEDYGPSLGWNDEYHCEDVVDTLAGFPNLTAVSLIDRGFSDTVLDSLSTVCPKLVNLKLDRINGLWEDDDDAPEDSGLTSAAGLTRAIQSLPGLTSLFYGMPFPLPDAVSKLQKLENLEIAGAPGPLPSSLGALSLLKSLSMDAHWSLTGESRITRLPLSCWQLPSLECLTINSVQLSTRLGNLTSLRFLSVSVSADNLPALNQSLPHLSNLEELKLLCPGLQRLPENLYRMEKLRSFTLNGSSLESMPDIRLCANGEGNGLEELTLTYFQPKLRGGLSCLSASLRSLTLEWYKHYLPYELGILTRLQKLCLHSCKEFEYFPESLTSLVALKELQVEACTDLEALPRRLGGCSRLEVLHVTTCRKLKTLPEDLGEMPSLRELRLRDLASLTQLPSLVNAKGLTKFLVRSCRKVLLSPGLLDLPSLDEASLRSLKDEMHFRESMREREGERERERERLSEGEIETETMKE